jgi:murein L,D-transpeptidase YafK
MSYLLKYMMLSALIVSTAFLTYHYLPSKPLPEGVKADKVVVLKSKRKLLLYKKDQLLKTYRIALGRSPKGHKQQEGDGKTPEGKYRISSRYSKSRFHRALRISYPNRRDRRKARKAGRSPGGDIMIHGAPNGRGWIGGLHTLIDWTQGCIAVTDKEIEEIWRAVPNRTPIEIKP